MDLAAAGPNGQKARKRRRGQVIDRGPSVSLESSRATALQPVAVASEYDLTEDVEATPITSDAAR